jgi:hypothetical protein
LAIADLRLPIGVFSWHSAIGNWHCVVALLEVFIQDKLIKVLREE